ncbi:MAG TPA: PQQ-dependent dehydrogenase, methanol/ethanol family, partial [Chloroflexia bacterium]|nr:PQQ-dependent dehydrogenase, methanol/ethanol family [Chloroflexia bacterium]
VAGGTAPDLRASPIPLAGPAFTAIVSGGALESRGMPVFEELTDQELEAIRHYIRERARYKPGVWDQVVAVWGYVVLLVKAQLYKIGWL